MGAISDATWQGTRPSGRSINDDLFDKEFDRSSLMRELCRLGLLPTGLEHKTYVDPQDHLMRHFTVDQTVENEVTAAYVAERRARRALAENRKTTKDARMMFRVSGPSTIEELVRVGKSDAKRKWAKGPQATIENRGITRKISVRAAQQNRVIADAIAEGLNVEGLDYAIAERLKGGAEEEHATVQNFLSVLEDKSPTRAAHLRSAILRITGTQISSRLDD